MDHHLIQDQALLQVRRRLETGRCQGRIGGEPGFQWLDDAGQMSLPGRCKIGVHRQLRNRARKPAGQHQGSRVIIPGKDILQLKTRIDGPVTLEAHSAIQACAQCFPLHIQGVNGQPGT